jgi:hypothetical protein
MTKVPSSAMAVTMRWTPNHGSRAVRRGPMRCAGPCRVHRPHTDRGGSERRGDPWREERRWQNVDRAPPRIQAGGVPNRVVATSRECAAWRRHDRPRLNRSDSDPSLRETRGIVPNDASPVTWRGHLGCRRGDRFSSTFAGHSHSTAWSGSIRCGRIRKSASGTSESVATGRPGIDDPFNGSS